MKTSLDVVTYGEAMTLFVAAETGDLAKVGQFTKRVAGADLNVAIGLSRLGFRVGWMSRVGRDSFGRYVLDVLAQEGIDASCVTIDERYPTGFQLKSKNDDGSDPAIEYFRKGSAASHLSLDDYVADYVLGARHLHLTGVAPAISATSRELAFHMAKEMRKAGKTISFDPNLRPTLWPSQEAMAEALNALATHADWVMPGVSEGKILTGFTKPEDIARFYLDQGAKGVVVKLGAHGAYFRTASNEEGTVPAIPVKNVVDTVGAGDAFFAIAAPLAAAGGGIDRIGFIGNVVGALKVEIVGHRRSIDKPSLVKALTGLLK